MSMVTWIANASAFTKIMLGTATIASVAVVGAPPKANEAPPETPPVVVQQAPEPVVTTKTVEVKSAVHYKTIRKNDSDINKGQTRTEQYGKNGTRTKTYKITYTDGEESDKELISNKVTKDPINKIILVGTYVAPSVSPSCDSNYSGGCVPIAYDVDCSGGSGNGPAYVSGPVYVVGSDIYGLDHDSDGVGCE